MWILSCAFMGTKPIARGAPPASTVPCGAFVMPLIPPAIAIRLEIRLSWGAAGLVFADREAGLVHGPQLKVRR